MIMDLKTTNRGKDYLIEQLQRERQPSVEELMNYSRKVGELETRLLQRAGPDEESTNPNAEGKAEI